MPVAIRKHRAHWVAIAPLESELYLIGMLHRLPLDFTLADLVPERDGVVLRAQWVSDSTQRA